MARISLDDVSYDGEVVGISYSGRVDDPTADVSVSFSGSLDGSPVEFGQVPIGGVDPANGAFEGWVGYSVPMGVVNVLVDCVLYMAGVVVGTAQKQAGGNG